MVEGDPAAVDLQEALEETEIAAGQPPAGEPLVQKCGAEADQHVIDRTVEILTCRLEQQVPVPDGGVGGVREPRDSMNTLVANTPDQLQRERFPLGFAPGL